MTTQQHTPEVGNASVSIDTLVELNAARLQDTDPGTSEHSLALRRYFVSVLAQAFPVVFTEVGYEDKHGINHVLQQGLEAGLGEPTQARRLLGGERNWKLFFLRQVAAQMECEGQPPQTFAELLFRLEGVDSERSTVWFRSEPRD